MIILSKVSNSNIYFIVIISLLYLVYSLWFSHSSHILIDYIRNSLTKIAKSKCKCPHNCKCWKMYINTKTNFWKHWIEIFSILFLIISSISFGVTVGSFSSSVKTFENVLSGINALILCVFGVMVIIAFVGMLIIISVSIYYKLMSSSKDYIGFQHIHIPLGHKILLKNHEWWSIFIIFVLIIILISLIIYFIF